MLNKAPGDPQPGAGGSGTRSPWEPRAEFTSRAQWAGPVLGQTAAEDQSGAASTKAPSLQPHNPHPCRQSSPSSARRASIACLPAAIPATTTVKRSGKRPHCEPPAGMCSPGPACVGLQPRCYRLPGQAAGLWLGWSGWDSAARSCQQHWQAAARCLWRPSAFPPNLSSSAHFPLRTGQSVTL